MEPDLDNELDTTPEHEAQDPTDALVRLMGGDPADEGEEQPQEQEPAARTYKVKVDGQELDVSEAELLAGYSRQGDYSKKTAALAQERAQLEHAARAVLAERQQHQHQLAQISQVLGLQLQEQSRTDWQHLLDTNPQEYLKQRHLFEQRQAAFHAAQRAQVQAHTQAKHAHARQFHQRLQNEHQALLDKLPDWKDADKATAEQAKVRAYLKGQGFSDDEVGGVADHRAVLMARKAMQFDELQAKASANADKVKNLPAPRVLQPGGRDLSPTDGRSRAMKTLARTGSTDAAADVLMALMSR